MESESFKSGAGQDHPPSYGSVLKEVGASVKGLFQSESELIKAEIEDAVASLEKHSIEIKADIKNTVSNLEEHSIQIKNEIKNTVSRVGKDSAQAVLFGALLSLSVFPFLAFLIVGLGKLMGDQYWLSALVVAAVCAGVGGTFAYRAYRRIKEEALILPRSIHERIQVDKQAVTKGVERHEDSTKRRAA